MYQIVMPKKKKPSAGIFSKVAPGLYLGNKDAAQEIMINSNKLELIAVINVGGGQSLHENTLKLSVMDREDCSMVELFDDACSFLSSHLRIALHPCVPETEIHREMCRTEDTAFTVSEHQKYHLTSKQRTSLFQRSYNTKDKVVLVHCRAGMHRSPTIICAYLIKLGYSLEDAVSFVKSRRSIAYPSARQLEDLKLCEE